MILVNVKDINRNNSKYKLKPRHFTVVSRWTTKVEIMLIRMFHSHGLFCATHPWEVIVSTVTLTICILSMGHSISQSFIKPIVLSADTQSAYCAKNPAQQCLANSDHLAGSRGVDIVVMTITRCVSLLYVYHQFRNMRKFRSKYIIGISGLLTVFSSLVFSSTVINLLDSGFTELNEALPFFLLLIDLSKASILAQLALSSSNQNEVKENIARGMSLLGPTITLDTIVETLVIGVGTLSGQKRLEIMCMFACMSVIVNYLVFMTFYPACLSLVLELSKGKDSSKPAWQMANKITRVLSDSEQKPNPVLQRVKLIMSAGLMLVHAHSRWPLFMQPVLSSTPHHREDSLYVRKEGNLLPDEISRWMNVSVDQLVMLILALSLCAKYILFESRDYDQYYESVMRSPSKPCQMNGGLPDAEETDKRLETNRRASIFVVGEDDEEPIKSYSCAEVQTEPEVTSSADIPKQFGIAKRTLDGSKRVPRSLDACMTILNNSEEGAKWLTDDEVLMLLRFNRIQSHRLEGLLGEPARSVVVRRQMIAGLLDNQQSLLTIPYENYDYSYVIGACCENVIGYVPVPLGVAGPLLLDGKEFHVPMATTEGCLVASTNRGCRAIRMCGGVHSAVIGDGMTRAPVVKFASAQRASEVLLWLQMPGNQDKMKLDFDSTSRFARLERIHARLAGRYLYIRFCSLTGDAMGMNMVSKGTEYALKCLKEVFPDMEILSLSGNFCSDKKPSAVNWIEGRGKSVVCEAILTEKVVEQVLKTSIKSLIEVNTSKNLIGSAMAGSIGGFNAHAANIVTAIYIATGQDPAQNVTSSNCVTIFEWAGDNSKDLHISCTMPSMEIGTVGGGTVLPAQGSCLRMLGVQGTYAECPGKNAADLARIVCGSVLAAELSILSALSSGDLVKSHLRHNRSQLSVTSPSPITPNPSFLSI